MVMSNRYPIAADHFPKWLAVLPGLPASPDAGEFWAENWRSVCGFVWGKTSSLRYVADKKDVWKPAAQTLADGYGDCEDYAIMWLHELLKLGVPPALVEIVIGLNAASEVHAVCYAYRDESDAEGMALDCQLDEPKMLSHHRTIFTPIYALSLNGARRFV
jgi:hypothetical protein